MSPIDFAARRQEAIINNPGKQLKEHHEIQMYNELQFRP
jgi:hypothetical protein